MACPKKKFQIRVTLNFCYRIANDGLESIYPYIADDRKVNIPKDDLIAMLLNNDPQNPPTIEGLSEIVQNQVANLSMYLIQYRQYEIKNVCFKVREAVY